jgi:hypothetical protein
MAFITVRHLEGEARRDMVCTYDDEQMLKIARDAFKDNQYVRVADMEKEGQLLELLESAFTTTNSIDSLWYKNLNIDVEENAKKGCRSTSVGDIVQINGDSYLVCGAGWIHLDSGDKV